MGKIISITLMFCCLSLAIWAANANAQLAIESESFCQRKEKVAKFQLYVQDVKTGPNTTVYEVARSNITSSSATDFGLINVMDNKITAEPGYDSEELGRLQGIVIFSDLQETAVTMNFNFYLTRGKYSGSTLTVLGRQSLFNLKREVPIVGGTGVFRMARGYAIGSTYSFEETYAVIEYTFYVFYVEEEPCLDQLVG